MRGKTKMIQCIDCEFYDRGKPGLLAFKCDPFSTIKEPECIAKWQLIKTDQMVAAYHATLDYYNRLAPMQEKMFRVMEREIDELDDSESWKYDDDDDEQDDEDAWR